LRNALEAYNRDHGEYPDTHDEWIGRYNTWGKAAEDWIPNLAPRYIKALPVDPRYTTNGGYQYLYRSDGRDFKLLTFFPEGDCPTITKERPELLDPIRGGKAAYTCHAYGFWSPGAAHW